MLLALLGVLPVVLSAYEFLQRCSLTILGEHAVGTVVALVADEKWPTPGEPITEFDLLPPTPRLRLTFTDYFGQTHEVTSDISVSPKKYRVGDQVPVVHRHGQPQTFFVDRFLTKWGGLLLFCGVGLALLICPVAFLATIWPAFGDWSGHLVRQAAPWLGPLFAIGLPMTGALLGAFMVRQRRRRLRENYRTQGTIIASGFGSDRAAGRARRRSWRWIRVAYRDADSHEQTRILPVLSGMLARRRQEGQTVDLLVDAPQDVLLNEPGELWFMPLMFLGLGSVITAVFTWAWLAGEMSF